MVAQHRLVFAGTPEFAARHLRALIDTRADIAAVYTQPDRPAGRGRKLGAGPVKQLALDCGIAVRQPESLRDATTRQELASLSPDVLVVVAYGLILPREVLDIPRLACINVHASLLPRWRGAAPIQRAVEAGDRESGITIMQMEEGLDSGPILATARLDLDPDMSAGDLQNALADIGPPLLLDTLTHLPEALRGAQVQDHGAATHAPKIDKSEARIDWRESAPTLARRIMAFNPAPGAWTEVEGERLKLWRAAVCEDVYAARGYANRGSANGSSAGEILRADESGLVIACGDGALRITEAQWPGARAVSAADLLRGRGELLQPGRRLGD